MDERICVEGPLMPGSKRYLRLKEHVPFSVAEHTPPPEYRERSDETLGPGPFLARADEHGFLMTGNHVDEDAPALAMLGGSFVESMFVPEQARFTSNIERRLALAGHSHRVLNGGYSGANTLQIAQVLLAKLPPILGAGGRVLLFIGQSDAEVLMARGTYWSGKPRIASVLPATEPQLDPYPPDVALTRVVALLAQLAISLGFRAGIVVSPFRDGDFSHDQVLRRTYRRDREQYQRTVDIRRKIQAVAIEVATAHELPCFDGQMATGGGEPSLFYDTMHLNVRGQELFSDALSGWILGKWLA